MLSHPHDVGYYFFLIGSLGLTETVSGQFKHSPATLLSSMQDAAAKANTSLPSANASLSTNVINLLPSRRIDIVRRAKTLITRISNTQNKNIISTGISAAEGSNSNSNADVSKHGFIIIKKDAVPNDTLLYFLILSLLKLSSKETVGTTRALLQACIEEAIARARGANINVVANGNGNSTNNGYDKIVEHLRLVEWEMKKGSVRLWKNVLRAMLGVDPLTLDSKNQLFPDAPIPAAVGTGQLALSTVLRNSANCVEKSGAMVALTNTQASEANGGAPVTKKRKKSKDSKTSFAETSISKSLAAFKKQQTTGKVEMSASNNGNIVLITQFESLLLSVVVSQGLPVFNEKWEGIVDPTIPIEHKYAESNITFHGMANVLLLASKHWSKISEVKLANARMKLDQSKQATNKANDPDLNKAFKMHLAAKNDAEVKSALVKEVEVLVKDYPKLTRYTIMLLETLRLNMGAVNLQGSNSTKKSTQQLNAMEGGLGAKVLEWQKKELGRWASKLQCEDPERHRPLAQTEYTRAGDSDQSKVSVAAKLDKKGCRAIFTQVAQQTRLRSVFFTNGELKAFKMIIKAVNQSEKALDVWNGRPDWWRRGGPDDANMLDQLLKVGYSGFSSSTVFKERLTHHQSGQVPNKAALQPRVYQIVREIAAIQEKEVIDGLVQKNRTPTGKGKNGSDKKNSSSIQAGLESFFTSQDSTKVSEIRKPSDNEKQAVILIGDDISDSPSSKNSSGKRKDQNIGQESTEKKAKVVATNSILS